MEKALVSVVLAVRNGEPFLKNTIKSVLNQTHEAIQLIVVDDGSTDATAEIVRSFTDPRVELYQLPENRHVSYATNAGLEKVRGEYIAIIDGDDMWAPNKLEKQLLYLKEHPEHAACFTWVDLIDENDTVINDKMPDLYDLFACSTDTQEDWLRFFFFRGNRLNNPSSLVTTKAAKEVGPHNLFYIQAQDMEWWVRFTKKYAFGVIEEPLTKYRRLNSESSISSVSEEKDSRFYNELMHIHYRFFDDMDDELFIRTFGQYFVKADSKTPEELTCEKVFLLLGGINGSQVPRAMGLLKAEQMLSDPKIADLMWSRYQFSTRACGEYSGKHVYNDPILQKRMEDYDVMQEELIAKRAHCEMYVEQIAQLNRAIDQKEEIVQLKNRELEEKEAVVQVKESELEQKEEIIQMKEKSLQLKDSILYDRNNIIERQKQEIARQKQEIEQLQAQHQQVSAQLTETVNTLNTVTNSNAWKMTAPVRKCMDRLRRQG